MFPKSHTNSTGNTVYSKEKKPSIFPKVLSFLLSHKLKSLSWVFPRNFIWYKWSESDSSMPAISFDGMVKIFIQYIFIYRINV